MTRLENRPAQPGSGAAPSLSRRAFLAAPLAAACSRKPPSAGSSRPPNIVFVMLDDLGYADFGCYGGEMIETPNVDRLAAESLRFTDAYAGGAVCAPARCSLMTGLHTGHATIRANAGTAPIRPEDVTVGEVLQQAGYVTGIFGKWGLGDAHTPGEPRLQGFDESFGYLHQIHAHSYYPEFLWKNGEKYLLPGNAGGKRTQYSADIIFEASLDFIRNNKDRPFFLYAAYTLPHGRYEVPSDAPYTDRDWPQQAKNFAAMVTRADDHIGRLWKLLQELGLEEDTVLFVTSDNGGTRQQNEFFHSNKPFRGAKGQLYEGGIRVPMIVRWAGKTDAGRVSDVPWYFCDFLPTAAELAGAPTPPGIDGKSVLPLIIGSSQPVHDYLYWEHYTYSRKLRRLNLDSRWQAVRMGEWKAVRPAPSAPLELYNLAEDVGETRDLAAGEPGIVKRMEEIIAAEHTEPGPHEGGTFQFATD